MSGSGSSGRGPTSQLRPQSSPDPIMSHVYVAAGSNVEPERNLALAVGELARIFPGARFSSWYRNKAVGFDGDDFINLVAELPTALTVHEVVDRLHEIEALCGRPPGA